ncbi:MAG: TlyA family RNA methyltransferase [Desulfocapsaceae bacterium]|nr:TlyA family RNA methyltransferase [Desulfocapsaceae bacterium]
MKRRLDELLVQRGLAEDLAAARALIGAGEVLVEDRVLDKAGSLVQVAAVIRIRARCPYVSRGGLKLREGLARFDIDPTDMVCIDVGASTGGFTDCLLQHGARKVYAVDVAYGQLDWKLRQDPRVVVMERFNARELTSAHLQESLDFAVVDASFISLTKLIPALVHLFLQDVSILALIKPQFELAREKIGPGGIVREAQFHDEVLESVQGFARDQGLRVTGVVKSPILGRKGNKEYLIHLANTC